MKGRKINKIIQQYFIVGVIIFASSCGDNPEQSNRTGGTVSVSDSSVKSTNTIAFQKPGRLFSFTFGKYCGECSHDCATMYQYSCGGNANTLWADYTDSYFKTKNHEITFGTPITDQSKFELADDILSHIPDTLILTEKTSQRFGCPDCNDGCGIYFKIQSYGVEKGIKQFYIDYQTESLNGEIKTFAEYLKITIPKFGEK